MKKKIVNLVVKGEVDINGISIKHIEGGFGEGLRYMTINDIATIHNQPTKEITRRINDNRQRFKDGIDILDIKAGGFEPLGSTLGYSKQSFNQANNIYVLSERGYSKLIKLLTDEKSWEAYDTLLDNYFRLREENKKLRKYSRSNNRFTTKCLLNLDGRKETETDFLFLTNNAVRNEVERIIDVVGVKAGVIAVNASLSENTISNWRTRRTSLDFVDLEKIVNVISKFKEFVE